MGAAEQERVDPRGRRLREDELAGLVALAEERGERVRDDPLDVLAAEAARLDERHHCPETGAAGVVALATFEYPLSWPPHPSPGHGSCNWCPRQPLFAKVVPVAVAICVKLVQPAPWHRSIRYPVTATLSVERRPAQIDLRTGGRRSPNAASAIGACVSALPPETGVFMSAWIFTRRQCPTVHPHFVDHSA